jgi:hypothetical protein
LPTLIIKTHQNTSYTFYTSSRVNSISSSFLQDIVVFLKHLANIKSLIPIMHFVLFDFCSTIQMVWIILSPKDHSTLAWLSEKCTLHPCPSAHYQLHLTQILLSVLTTLSNTMT